MRLSNGCRPDKVSHPHHLRLTSDRITSSASSSNFPANPNYTQLNDGWLPFAFQTSWTCSVGQLPFVRNTETSVLTTIVSASNLLTKTFCPRRFVLITVRAVIVKVITLYEQMLVDRFILTRKIKKRESNKRNVFV